MSIVPIPTVSHLHGVSVQFLHAETPGYLGISDVSGGAHEGPWGAMVDQNQGMPWDMPRDMMMSSFQVWKKLVLKISPYLVDGKIWEIEAHQLRDTVFVQARTSDSPIDFMVTKVPPC